MARKNSRTGSAKRVRPRSYTPISDALAEPFRFADTELAEGISRHGLVGLLTSCISRKRRRDGEPLGNVLCALLVWPLLNLQSIHCYCSELGQILQGKVSVLYDFLGREDVGWRAFSTRVARRIGQENDLGPIKQRAFVIDDSLKERSGRKVEGSSIHFDHTTGKTLQGHQVLQLGLAGTKGFVPVDTQIVMSQVNPIDKPEQKGFSDHRSSAAQDMRRARTQSKPENFRNMLRQAIRAGWSAAYLLADAWFGCKENIALSLELGLIGIFQMKRGNLIYRYQGSDNTAAQLYARVQRRMRPENSKARFKTASIIVRINLQTNPRKPAKWARVRLVFSAPVRARSVDTWVLFACTDPTMCDAKILQVYSLRWSIEVYFKEIKQNLGLFKEQSGRYQLAYASVHLSAIRYLLLFEAMLRGGGLSYGEIRDRQSGKLQVLTYATLLWELFRALIDGALEELVAELGRKVVTKVATVINQAIEEFLLDALQMKPDQIEIQIEAEDLGYI